MNLQGPTQPSCTTPLRVGGRTNLPPTHGSLRSGWVQAKELVPLLIIGVYGLGIRVHPETATPSITANQRRLPSPSHWCATTHTIFSTGQIDLRQVPFAKRHPSVGFGNPEQLPSKMRRSSQLPGVGQMPQNVGPMFLVRRNLLGGNNVAVQIVLDAWLDWPVDSPELPHPWPHLQDPLPTVPATTGIGTPTGDAVVWVPCNRCNR